MQLTVTKIFIYTIYLYIFITVKTAPQLNRNRSNRSHHSEHLLDLDAINKEGIGENDEFKLEFF